MIDALSAPVLMAPGAAPRRSPGSPQFTIGRSIPHDCRRRPHRSRRPQAAARVPLGADALADGAAGGAPARRADRSRRRTARLARARTVADAGRNRRVSASVVMVFGFQLAGSPSELRAD